LNYSKTWLKNKKKQRLDSVLINANVKNMSRIMLFHKLLSNFMKDKKTAIKIFEELANLISGDEEQYS